MNNIYEVQFYNRSHGERIIEGLENGTLVFGRNSRPVLKICLENAPEECSEIDILDMFKVVEDASSMYILSAFTHNIKAPANLFLRASDLKHIPHRG